MAGAAVTQATNPIQHVVVIMEENHTFDNYFGDFPGVGANGITEPPASNPAPHDIDHSGPRTRFAIDGGAMDGFDPLGGLTRSISGWARTSTPMPLPAARPTTSR
jgi:phospholipase C